MKMIRIMFALVLSVAMVDIGTVYSETIYTKDGEVIQAKVTEKTEDTIWYEATAGEIIEEIGIDLIDVQEILNADGSISKYSPTN